MRFVPLLTIFDVGEAEVVGTRYTATVLPVAVEGMVPEMPFSDPQLSTGVAGGVMQPEAVTLLD